MAKMRDTQRKAVIDIGSNSIRLLIAGGGKPETRALVTTRLYAGLQPGGILGKEALKRSMDALILLQAKIKEEGVKKIYTVATSAVRDAANREEFVRAVKKELGLEVTVLSIEQEAKYSFLGACHALDILPQETVVFDLGGGSTEIAWGGRPLQWQSLALGAVRTTNEVSLEEHEINALYSFVAAKLIGVPHNLGERYRNQVAVGGTVTNLAAIKLRLPEYSPGAVHGTRLRREEISEMLALFRRCSPAERRKIPGLQPSRADIIITGTIIVLVLMDHWGISSLIVSKGDLLDGILEASSNASGEITT